MKGRLRTWWREWGSPLVFALLFTQFGATAVRVSGASMLPGLRHGELLLVPKIEGWAHRLGLGEYRQGDIVVFKPPAQMQEEWRDHYSALPLPWRYRPYLVKRVVGVPGDRVAVRGGKVWVNGRTLPEATRKYWASSCLDTRSVLANSVAASPAQPDQPEVTVPAGHYFVMGDNRSPGGSLDSRVFGPVALGDLAGRAVASVWPLFVKASATPPCDGLPDPERRVTYSGDLHFNVRTLTGGTP